MAGPPTVDGQQTTARQKHYEGLARPTAPLPPVPVTIDFGVRLYRQSDTKAACLRHWCGALEMVLFYHRKVWEDCFVVQALWEAGVFEAGKRGSSFAVAVETLTAFFASREVDMLGTDLPIDRRVARGWQRTGQQGSALSALSA